MRRRHQFKCGLMWFYNPHHKDVIIRELRIIKINKLRKLLTKDRNRRDSEVYNLRKPTLKLIKSTLRLIEFGLEKMSAKTN